MERKIEFSGTGGALFGKFFVGTLLTGITLGIYLPWFIVNLYKYIAENLTLKTEAGDVKFTFNGTGGSLFGTYIVGAILTGITLGIYIPWFLVKLTKYFTDNASATASDNSTYTLQFNGTAGSLFVTYLVGAILTGITFGIYAPWFWVNMTRYFMDNTNILKDGNNVGSFSFKGEGSELLGTYIIGMLLTMITLGIYSFWFEINIIKYFNRGTKISLNDASYALDFTGEGATYFGINIVGMILTSLTFGIYGAWFMCNLLKFRAENTKILNNN
ncbi:MAG: DUF898 family protein [Deltaproteobacteria bacterium]|nr:DUF898 family protein [Deltaproteobacteria bacterium]